MSKEKFIEDIKDILGVETLLDTTQKLNDFERWDSLSMLSMLDLYDELGIDVDVIELEECKSVDDLLKLAHFDNA